MRCLRIRQIQTNEKIRLAVEDRDPEGKNEMILYFSGPDGKSGSQE